MDSLNLALLIGAAAVIAAIVAVHAAHRTGLPSLLAYLGLGLLLGESGFGILFSDARLAEMLGLSALALILAEGGITTNWQHVRRAVPAAFILATVGVTVSIGVVAAAVHVLLGLDWRLALLLGAVLAPTDAAAVFSVLRRLPLPPRLKGVLEAESGFNDAPVVIIVVLLSTAPNLPAPVNLITHALYELAVGALVGLTIGPLGAYALRRVALPASGLYPIAVLSLTVAAYAVAAVLNASGFLAVYLAALVLGNARLPHRPATRGFAEGIAWLAQIGLFVMLGLLASPSRLPPQIVPGLVAGFALVLLARPLSVVVSAQLLRPLGGLVGLVRRPRSRTSVAIRRLPAFPATARAAVDGPASPSPSAWELSWRDQAFLSWAGLRGAVPIVLATIPMSQRVPGADELFAIVFVVVLAFTLLQGPTLPWVARLLHVTAPAEPRDLDVEAAPLEELHAELLQIRIPPDSRLHGVEIFELRLPADAAITLIVRDGRSFVPDQTTPLRAGDELLVITTAACREAVERRLRAVSRRGKLAGWYGERGD